MRKFMTKQDVLEIEDGIAVLTLDNPPVNALSPAVRTALVENVAAANADPAISAIVIRCAGTTFFAGADIREFDKPLLTPLLPEVVAQIEASAKPVVAEIHGTALGGGLEVAMACHVRVAATDARLGLPEVKLGLLPGAGGTQRLPRLIGIDEALGMMTSGDPVSAIRAQTLGLVDRVVHRAQLHEEAVASARVLAGTDLSTLRTDRLPIKGRTGAEERIAEFAEKNARKFRNLEAPGTIIDVVRHGLAASFDEALKFERESFLKLRGGAQSAALRYSFNSEREASRIPMLVDGAAPRPVESVGVIGAGTMGVGISLNFLLAGIPVILVEQAEAALDRGAQAIRSTIERNIASGRTETAAGVAAIDRLNPSLDMSALASCDLVIEAAFETMEVKTSIFTALDAIMKQGAILATNTSYLDVDAIAAVTARPEDVVGLHFFSPANIMKLLEVVVGSRTAPDVLATAAALAKRIRKVAVFAGNAHGFIGNRMLAVRRREAEQMILQGASPYAIDRVIEDFGLPMGPFRMADLAGLDLGWNAAASRGSTVRERLCEMDRRGQKTGAGFYDYDESRRALPSPVAEEVIARFAADNGYDRRAFDDQEIADRLLLPMVSEGTQILAERRALRGSDVDVVWRNGYGWPAWRGGPMYWADQQGLAGIVARLEALAKREGDQFQPAPLLVDLAAKGLSLSAYRNDQLAA
jgi:3-hydroxyacyl-CoA dehydrogenase